LAQLGVVFQSRALDADITVEQNLVYHAALHGFSRREALVRAAGRLDTIVEQSGGETMAGAFAKLVQEDAQDSADEDS
jgi:ABC-type Na+ transport system ATPase subunit NatA